MRDLLRKRSQLVRQRSSQILSIENLIARNLGARASGNEVKRCSMSITWSWVISCAGVGKRWPKL